MRETNRKKKKEKTERISIGFPKSRDRSRELLPRAQLPKLKPRDAIFLSLRDRERVVVLE